MPGDTKVGARRANDRPRGTDDYSVGALRTVSPRGTCASSASSVVPVLPIERSKAMYLTTHDRPRGGPKFDPALPPARRSPAALIWDCGLRVCGSGPIGRRAVA